MVDSLLGIALVAQRYAEPPYVLYHYPPRPQDPPCHIYTIPLTTFADMMIPCGFLRNRAFEISLDVSHYSAHGSSLRREFETAERLRFTSFPCDIQVPKLPIQVPEFVLCSDSPTDSRSEIEDGRSVEFFNIVFVTDGRKPLSPIESEGLSSVASHFSKGLISEEGRAHYMTKEVNHLVRARADLMSENGMPNSPLASDWKSSLTQSLKELFHGLQDNGSVPLHVNQHLLCHVSIRPKTNESDFVVAPHQSLVLLQSVSDIQKSLPVDCADVIRRLVDIADAFKSMRDISKMLAIPLATAQRLAHHLVYWRRAIVINKLNKHQKLMLALQSETEFEQAFREDFATKTMTLSEVLYCFSQEDDVEGIRRRLETHVGHEGKKLFSQILAWVIARGLVKQVMSYYHFLPPRRDVNAAEIPDWLLEDILTLYPLLRSDDVQSIYQVHQEQVKVQFCCRFLHDFILTAVDEWSIHAILSANHESKEMYSELVKNAKDPKLFYLYECDCV